MAHFFLLFVLLMPFACVVLVLEYVNFSNKELSRKSAHVISGITLVIATYVLSQELLLVLGLLLLVAAFVARTLGFSSLFDVGRASYGLLAFAFSFLLMVMLFSDANIEFVRLGLWLLVIPDTLAALIGKRWGREWLFGKSLLGSAVFFFSSFCILLLYSYNFFTACVVAIILTLIELFSRYGLDNIFIPLSAGLLLTIIL